MSRGVRKASRTRTRKVRVNFRRKVDDVPVFDRGKTAGRYYDDPGDYPDPDDGNVFEEFAREKALYGSD